MINKYAITIIICLLVGMLFIVLRRRIKLQSELMSLEVNGKIMRIEYREKEMPFFYVKKTWVYFGPLGYSIDQYLDEGDSIVKRSDSDLIELYKKTQDSSRNQKYLKVMEILI